MLIFSPNQWLRMCFCTFFGPTEKTLRCSGGCQTDAVTLRSNAADCFFGFFIYRVCENETGGWWKIPAGQKKVPQLEKAAD